MNEAAAAMFGPGYHVALPTQPTTRSLDVHRHRHVLLKAPSIVPQMLEEHLFGQDVTEKHGESDCGVTLIWGEQAAWPS